MHKPQRRNSTGSIQIASTNKGLKNRIAQYYVARVIDGRKPGRPERISPARSAPAQYSTDPERVTTVNRTWSCSDPDSPHIFSLCWAQLPVELSDYILSFMENFSSKLLCSKLSFISHAWCRRFRRHLFSTLLLRSEEDCRTLYAILNSSLSSWLAAYITRLSVKFTFFLNRPISKTLLCLLPACRVLRENSTPSPPSALPGCIPRSAALKSSLHNIGTLALHGSRFPSFRVLLGILVDIVHLEDLRLTNVTWSGDPTILTEDQANNLCSGSYRHLRSVELWQCTDNLALPIWIMATASTRCTFTRLRTAAPAMPADTWALIDLMQKLLLEDRIQWTIFEITKETPNTIVFRGHLFYAPPYIAAQFKVETIKYMPPSGNGDAWRIRTISLASANNESTFFYLHARSWTALRVLLLAFPYMPQFHVLSSNNRAEGSADTLSTVIMQGVDHHPAVTFKVLEQDLGQESPWD
ncbi:hypothetical protein PsYK624_030850 [Phanerochaete sordida]|uniref:F-box domain-containing protein n=1 Tax=Phanerochaete sordida TaxID=48140 RepID=A0A9P3G2P2_9APHY|nr:hypothetical protein PsYK624_030850 [Phanerochaete sordida]